MGKRREELRDSDYDYEAYEQAYLPKRPRRMASKVASVGIMAGAENISEREVAEAFPSILPLPRMLDCLFKWQFELLASQLGLKELGTHILSWARTNPLPSCLFHDSNTR